MDVKNPHYREQVQEIFRQAAFVMDVGIQLQTVEPGRCETELVVLSRHLQQDAFIHAGVQATMADHTAGAAAGTLVAANELVLTVEFKINLLRPAQGERLHCQAVVLKPGRTIIVVESEVYALKQAQSALVSKATVTIAVVPKRAE